MVDTVSLAPTAPSRNDDPSTFVARADAFVAWLETLTTELNTSIAQMNLEFTGTYYDGAWSSASGSKTAPKVYSHDDSAWVLLNNAADITATEPGVDNSDYLLLSNKPTSELVLQTLTGTTPTWTMSDGAAASLTLSGNSTVTLSGTPAGTVAFFAFLRVIQDGSASGYTLAFAGSTVVTEDGQGLPVLSSGANDIDDFVLYTLDGGTTYMIRRVIRNPS